MYTGPTPPASPYPAQSQPSYPPPPQQSPYPPSQGAPAGSWASMFNGQNNPDPVPQQSPRPKWDDALSNLIKQVFSSVCTLFLQLFSRTVPLLLLIQI